MVDPYLHLFLDDEGITARQNIWRMVHTLRRESLDPVFAPGGDEGTATGYGTVCYDETAGQYRLWYAPHVDGLVRTAVSPDMRQWRRQGLAIEEASRRSVDNLAVVRIGPQADPWFNGARWAGFVFFRHPPREDALRGLHLVRYRDGGQLEVKLPGFLPGVGDRSSLTYDSIEQSYHFISRPAARLPGFRTDELQRPRLANLWTSPDLTTWTNRGIALGYDEADPADAEIYGLQPFRYGPGWLAFVEMYHRNIERLDTHLAYSADGWRYQRIFPREPVLRWGEEGAWDTHWVTPTFNEPFIEGDRLLVPYIGAGTKHGSGVKHQRAVGLASIRRDGFVSMEAGRNEPAVLVTRALPCQCPMKLTLNVQATAGFVAVEVIPAVAGKETQAVGGYDGAASRAEDIDSVEHRVMWADRKVVEPCESGMCYLRFTMRQASLFSYRWSPAE